MRLHIRKQNSYTGSFREVRDRLSVETSLDLRNVVTASYRQSMHYWHGHAMLRQLGTSTWQLERDAWLNSLGIRPFHSVMLSLIDRHRIVLQQESNMKG